MAKNGIYVEGLMFLNNKLWDGKLTSRNEVSEPQNVFFTKTKMKAEPCDLDTPFLVSAEGGPLGVYGAKGISLWCLVQKP